MLGSSHLLHKLSFKVNTIKSDIVNNPKNRPQNLKVDLFSFSKIKFKKIILELIWSSTVEESILCSLLLQKLDYSTSRPSFRCGVEKKSNN